MLTVKAKDLQTNFIKNMLFLEIIWLCVGIESKNIVGYRDNLNECRNPCISGCLTNDRTRTIKHTNGFGQLESKMINYQCYQTMFEFQSPQYSKNFVFFFFLFVLDWSQNTTRILNRWIYLQKFGIGDYCTYVMYFTIW